MDYNNSGLPSILGFTCRGDKKNDPDPVTGVGRRVAVALWVGFIDIGWSPNVKPRWIHFLPRHFEYSHPLGRRCMGER